jgi:hypothetical protein
VANQQYSFQSVWKLSAPRDEVWQVMTATPFSWDQWWPQLTNLRDVQTVPGLSGTSFSCTWRAPLGYKLDCHIVIGETIDAKRVSLNVNGDLRGQVVCALSDDGNHTRVEVDWQVETTAAWMNRLAPLLKPVFTWGHHAVMRSGQAGLQCYLAKR